MLAIVAAGLSPEAKAGPAETVVGGWERESTSGCSDGAAAYFLSNGVVVLLRGEGVIESVGRYEALADGTVAVSAFAPWPLGSQPPEEALARMATARMTVRIVDANALDVTMVIGRGDPSDRKQVALVRCPP